MQAQILAQSGSNAVGYIKCGSLPLLGFNSEILPIVYLPPSAQPCLSVEGFDEREWTRRSPATGQSGTSGGLRCCKTRQLNAIGLQLANEFG